MMRGQRQGMIRNYGAEVPLYDYGAEVPLYDYSGLGMDLGYGGLGIDLGNPLMAVYDKADAVVTDLPAWGKFALLVAGGLGLYCVGTGKVKLGMKKSRSNPRRRRKSTTTRKRRTMRRRNRR